MKRSVLLCLCLALFASPAAWADDPVDEPGPSEEPFDEEEEGIDMGVYFSAGKALRIYDFERLNHQLAFGGTDPFGEYIWSQETGGRFVGATLEGWEVLFRSGAALASNDRLQLFPCFGFGYAQHTLTLDGDLSTLPMSNLPRSGEEEIKQYGLLLEAAIRVDLYNTSSQETSVSFLMAQSLSLGYLGVPWHSKWHTGDHNVDGVPNAFNGTFFIRYSVGFGVGVRRLAE